MINKLTLLLLVGFFALCGCTADDETLASVTYGTPSFAEVNPGIGRAEFVWSPNDDDAVYTEIYANDALLQKVYYTAGTSEVSRIIAMDSGEYSFYIVNVNADDSRSSKISYSKKVTVYDESDGEDLEAMTLDSDYISQDDENGGRISWQTDDETIVGNTVSYVDSDCNPCLVYSAVEDGECYYPGAAFGTEFTYVSHYLPEEGAIDSFVSEAKSGIFENQTIMYTYEADGKEYELKRVYVSSITEMIKYMGEDCTGYHVTMKKGTYRVKGSDMRDESIIPLATADVCGNVTQAIFLVAGERNVYDFNDSTIILEIKSVYANCGYELFPLHFMGNHNIVKNYVQIDEGEEEDYPANGCVNVTMDGSYNVSENLEVHSKGSYPYGYGEVFGKGGSSVLNLFKHCAINIRGTYNLVDACRFYHKAFGHVMFSQAAYAPVVRNCYFEGEMTTTNFVLNDPRTSGANGVSLRRASDVSYYTTWGYYVPEGYTMSCVEGCMRAYTSGSTTVNGVHFSGRATGGCYWHDNITVNSRAGTALRLGGGDGISGGMSGLTDASGTYYSPAWYNPSKTTGGHYVERITALGCDSAVGMGNNQYADDCYANAQHGLAFGLAYDSDSGVTADITLLPFKTNNSVFGNYPGSNGSGQVAHIRGLDHNITFNYLDLRPDDSYGWTRKGESLAIYMGGNLNNIGAAYETYSESDDEEEEEEEEEEDDDDDSGYVVYGNGRVPSNENDPCRGVTLNNNNHTLGYTPYRVIVSVDAGLVPTLSGNALDSYSSSASTKKNTINTALKSDVYFIQSSEIDFETNDVPTSGTANAESRTTVNAAVSKANDDYASTLGLGSVDIYGVYSYEDEYFEQGPEVYMKH